MATAAIKLTKDQRKEIEAFCEAGGHSKRLVNRAKIILLLDTSVNGKSVKYEEIERQVKVSNTTINNVKNAFLEADCVKAFLTRKKRATPPIAPKITGDVEAQILALARGEVPRGYSRWTLQLLADKSVELNYIDSISDMTVHRLLKKHNLRLV